MQIGLACFKDKQLSSMVGSYNRVGNCEILHKTNEIVYDTEDDSYLVEYIEDILDAFTVAKYLKISESDERTAYLKDYLFKWDIFNGDRDDIQKIIVAICHERYKEEKELFEEKVTIRELFDVDELEKNCLLKNYTWENFSYHIKHINRFHSHQINLLQFEKLLKNMMLEIPKGSLKLYRSRICDEENYDTGYSIRKMGVPPMEKATAGRTNSEGVQCLYLSSDIMTTFHEVRARDYDHVCVGTFLQNKDIKIVDLSLFDEIGPFSNPDFDISWFAVNIEIIRKIGSEIAKPMRRFDSALDYIPTQYICDYIKYLGYDGIKFKSTLASGGINYAIFDEKKFECTEVNVKCIGGVEYSVLECTNTK